jgi:curved DNA-binding protein CbpA
MGGDQREMMRVNEAWRVLRSPASRAAYDSRRGIRSVANRPSNQAGDVVLDFGRYAGWTLDAVAAADDDYLAWLQRAPAGLSIRSQIAAVLADRRRSLDGLRSPQPAHR